MNRLFNGIEWGGLINTILFIAVAIYLFFSNLDMVEWILFGGCIVLFIIFMIWDGKRKKEREEHSLDSD